MKVRLVFLSMGLIITAQTSLAIANGIEMVKPKPASMLAPGALDNVEKKEFRIDHFKTAGGSIIEVVRIGYETYGALNDAGDNAILVAHHFTGSSHAAGHYANESAADTPGEWNELIGPQKVIDTEKYFVISADSLANMNPKNLHVITTGPASIDPKTGKAYGLKFPVVTIKDFVETQHRLAVSLKIKRFRAVIGASMGSMQALEWATDYPEMVDRAIAVIPAGLSAAPHLIATMNTWVTAITNDPQFNGGAYDQKKMLAGLANAFGFLIMQSQNISWTETARGENGLATLGKAGASPFLSFENHFAIENTLAKVEKAFAADADANSFLYTAKAVQLYQLGQANDLDKAVARIKAKILLLPARSDLLLFPKYTEDAFVKLKAAHKDVALTYIEGEGGHVDGISKIMQVAPTIQKFLEH